MDFVLERIGDFMAAGGDVLKLIFAVTLAMWTLILERAWFFRLQYPKRARAIQAAWAARTDKVSWRARQIRDLWISESSIDLNKSLRMIQTLVAICPLLGLLGTVTGMIEVFDVMASAGNSNPRAMASGVSKATIPTMSGLLAALSGLYFSVQLKRFAQKETDELSESLIHD
jgi:biopolymer transport protein ExbB